MAGLSGKPLFDKSRMRIVTVDPKLMPAPHINPYLRLLIYIYYIFVSGCIYWGWNGIQEILYKAGSFEDTCTDPSKIVMKLLHGEYYIDCPARSSGINNLFTLAFANHFICSFIGGYMLDNFGPRICFIVGHVFSLLAWLLVFCAPRNGRVLRLAFILIGVFCEACYIPLLSVNAYFPNGNSTVLAILGSCRSLSYLIPTILGAIYHIEGFDRDMLYVIGIVYLLLANGLCLISGSFIVPTTIPHSPEEMSEIAGDKTVEESGEGEVVNKSRTRANISLNGIKAAMKGGAFAEFCILALTCTLFLASVEFINKSQRNLLVASGEGGDATDVFKYFNILTFVPAPFLGAVMDKVGPAIVMNILQIFAVLYYLCASFDVYAMKVAACCCYFFAGSLACSSIYCYINKRFPKEYFGTFSTAVFVVGGSITLINIPIYNYGLTLESDIIEVQFRPMSFLFMGYMIVASCLSGCLIYISVVKEKKKGSCLVS